MSANSKHPLRKIHETGAEPIDLQARKGLTNRPDPLQAAVERLEAAEREKEREEARTLTEWKDRQKKFSKQLYDTLRHFRVTASKATLPFAITDPARMSIVVPSDVIPVWSEAALIDLMDSVRTAFAGYAPTERFPFAFTEPDTKTIIIPARRISFDTTNRVLRIYTAEVYQRILKQVLWDTEQLRI